MEYSVALLIFGVLLLLVGLVGKVKAKELEIGTDSVTTRVVVGIVGMVLLLLSVLLSPAADWLRPDSAEETPAPTPALHSRDATVPRLSAPVPQATSCDVTIRWPADQSYMIVGWEQVQGASYYSVEMDCLGCGGGAGWFSLREDRSWHLREEIGLRAPQGSPAIYSTDIYVRLRREGGRALRWRVWAVDHEGIAGDKSAWCRITFAG
jgi:hypothetical protein